ncbi:DMT family transporter [Providencia burhodogranariea]|uniref:Threonine/homoserine exporter RhtA n=1 Tax=Providencia burhodogranariea DSM 19968 TaxID=1141662 RepID=K8WHZ4_9GAMM|nr:DMT family transporter [Providencia burhodogranariea]EKT57102.1 hypothetical protein OOA_14590 [Providencia burhodogranariea DSM 19968]
MIKEKKLLWFALFIALLWGGGFPISKIAIEQIGVWSFRFYCNLISVILLTILVILFFRFRPQFSDILLCIPLGTFNIFLVPLLNNWALDYTDAAKASVLIYMMPTFTSLIHLIISRKIYIKYIIISILSCIGIFIFISLDEITIGEIIILVSAFFWAVGTFLSEKIPTKLNLFSKVLYQNIVSLFFILLITPFISTEIYQPLLLLRNPEMLIPIIYMGLASGVIVYILWFYMIEHGGSELTSYAVLLSPIISVFISWLFLNEIITLNMLVGMMFILSSVFIAFKYKDK